MITREQVEDLRLGDVVRVTGWCGLTVEGPLSEGTKSLWLGQHLLVRDCDGSVGHWAKIDATLTVISRAPRPLYVNHPRTEPVVGDVVRDGEGLLRVVERTDELDELVLWGFGALVELKWLFQQFGHTKRPLHLLVDGETGQVVL